MFLRVVSVFLLALIIPFSALAQEENITRRDGFLLLWDTIQRKAYDTWKEPFSDVQEGDYGFQKITWAKRRGILEDEKSFRPDDLLTVQDALLWTFRTRNVADLDQMQIEHIPTLLQSYPIEDAQYKESDLITRTKLEFYISELNKIFDQQTHQVSLYAEDFHGKGTAFGETFDMHALTAAHRTFPHNTLVRVTNLDNNKTVVVRINDRGPYVHGRSLDLSLAAFTSIAERSRGLITAKLERLGDQELINEEGETIEEVVEEEEVQEIERSRSRCADEKERYRFQKRVTRDVRFNRGIPHTLSMGDDLFLKANRWFVVRKVIYPDGNWKSIQNWIDPEDAYLFSPSTEGEYIFVIGNKYGNTREMRMRVEPCAHHY